MGAQGRISARTRVFDPTVTSLGEWRARFQLDLKDSYGQFARLHLSNKGVVDEAR